MPRLLAVGTLALAISLLFATGTGAAPATNLDVYAGRTSQVHPMVLSFSSGRLRQLFTTVDVGPCDSGRTFNIAFDFPKAGGVRLSRTGHFTLDTPITGPAATGEQLDLHFRDVGSVGRAGASGTMQLSGSIRDAQGNTTDHCDSGSLKWGLKLGRTYGGRLLTSQHGVLSIRLEPRRRRIKSFLVDFPIKCGAKTYRFTLDHLGIPVGRDGKFAKHGLTGVRLEGPDGATVSGQYELHGQLGIRRAAGTYRAFGTARARDGSTAKCESGTLRWSAAGS